MPAPDHALLYDSDCGFCTRALQRIMRWDRRARLRAVAIQSEEGDRLLTPIPPDRRLDSWHLVEPGGAIRSAGDAAPPLLRLLPGGAPLAALLALFPAMTERAYGWVAAHRDLFGRLMTVILALAVVGCGSSVQAGSELTVYASLPLSGADGREGREALAGAELALAEAGAEAGGVPVSLEALDDVAGRGAGAGWTQAQVAANAREASEDSTAIAYLGELDSAATRIAVPITNDAAIPQVSPGPVAEGLLREPGGNDPPEQVQTSGERTLAALREPGERPRAADPAFAVEFEAATGRRPGPAAAYGFEAMALLLDAIGRADDPLDRSSVSAALLATDDRDSVLGSYSLDQAGLAQFE